MLPSLSCMFKLTCEYSWHTSLDEIKYQNELTFKDIIGAHVIFQMKVAKHGYGPWWLSMYNGGVYGYMVRDRMEDYRHVITKEKQFIV